MEVLIELLLQIFFEVFGELILTAFIKIIGLFYIKIDKDKLLRSRLKFVLTYVFIGLITILLVNSLLNSTRFLIVISLSYMLFQIVVTLLQIINQDKKSHPLMKFIYILRKISHYAYPLLLIVFSSVYLDNVGLLSSIIIISSMTLVVWFMIDMYRVWKWQRLKGKSKRKKSS